MARCSSCAIITFPLPKNYMVLLLSYILSNIVSFCNQSCEIVQHMTNFISGYHSVSVHFSYARFCITNYGLKTEQLCVIINPIQEFPFFDSKFVCAERGSCGAKILKISCAWTERSGAVGFLTPTKKRAACYLFLRGIYVAFFGCKSECADLAKNRSGILMLRFGLLIRAGNRHGFRYGWGTKFSDCMEVRRLVCGRRFPQTIKARDWVVMRRLY